MGVWKRKRGKYSDTTPVGELSARLQTRLLRLSYRPILRDPSLPRHFRRHVMDSFNPVDIGSV